jgi:hypothetical protein
VSKRTWSQSEALEVWRRYDREESMAEIAATMPYSINTIRNMLLFMGADIRSRRGPGREALWKPEDAEAAKIAYNEGVTVRELVAKTGLAHGTVIRMLASVGTVMRTRGRPRRNTG